MAAFSQTIFFNAFFLNENFCVLIKISLKFVPKGPIDNKPALVQIMAWCQIGDKPLSAPMLNQFTDAYICYTGERWVNSWCAEFIWENEKNISFSMLRYTGTWNPSPCMTVAHLSHIINTMAADDLAMEGARASTAMVLMCLSWNILTSAPQD